jgi:hypothetical protein
LERLASAIKSGTYVSNDAAQATIQQIIDHKKQQAQTNAAENQV